MTTGTPTNEMFLDRGHYIAIARRWLVAARDMFAKASVLATRRSPGWRALHVSYLREAHNCIEIALVSRSCARAIPMVEEVREELLTARAS